MVLLETCAAVIEKLGGNRPVMEITGAHSESVVSNWRRNGFPAKTFLALTAALEREGCEAPPSLWGMREPQEAAP